jgi:uncharacterized protein YegP (UPF0339 family)
MKFVLFKDKGGKWRWHLIARNGRKTATSGESFSKKGNALRAARKLCAAMRAPAFVDIVDA